MRQHPARSARLFLFAGLAALAATALPAAAQDSGQREVTKVRVETRDCPLAGCGAVFDDIFDVEEMLQARRQAGGQSAQAGGEKSAGNGTGGGANRGQGLKLGQKNNAAQRVFLNFDAGDAFFDVVDSQGNPIPGFTFESHQFTQAERDAIQRRLEADYAGFNVTFTQTRPEDGDFTTLSFACGDPDGCLTLTADGGLSILFGQADNIDFRNQNRGDSAFIDVNLWEFAAQFNPALFEQLSGREVSALSEVIVNQAANTGAHELGHILGLRHHDAFGAPGDGLPATGVPSPGDFVPVYEQRQNAEETILHLMASGASVGLPLVQSADFDRFFSERSTVKNAVAERGLVVSEAAVQGNNGGLKLRKTPVPNPLEAGENADGGLNVRASVVEGRIERESNAAAPESDRFRFRGKAGEFINAEVVSFANNLVADPVITALTLFVVEDDGSLTQVFRNDQNFEPFDPLLADVELPRDGEYVLQVSAPNVIFLEFDPTSPGLDPFPLDQTGNAALRSGDYELLVYTVDGKLGGGPQRVPGPSASSGS